jgi:hypothetical protein
MNPKKIITFIAALVAAAFIAEGLARISSSSMKNYEIEMWRYAKELKVRSKDPALNHEHIRSSNSILQGVEININRDGFRGPNINYQNYSRRMYFLGGSMLLGWGLPEDRIATTLIQKELPNDTVVINGGVGNYNAERYSTQFFQNVNLIKPTDVIVFYYLRDAENLDAGSDSPLIKNSQVLTLILSTYKKMKGVLNNVTLNKHFDDVYKEDAPGFIKMKNSIINLQKYCIKNNINFSIYLLPDFNNFKDYKFYKQRDILIKFCSDNSLKCIDTLPDFEEYKDDEFRVMHGDPHPNAKANKIIANKVLTNIK